VVQDPQDARYGEMPQNALDTAGADHLVSIDAMAPLLSALARDHVEGGVPPGGKRGMGSGCPPGAPSPFACPDCGGVLWQPPAGEPLRFECRTGHGFASDSLARVQEERAEEALWAAIRSLEETAAMARRLERRAHEGGSRRTGQRFGERAREHEARAAMLRRLVGAPPPTLPAPGSEPRASPARAARRNGVRRAARG